MEDELLDCVTKMKESQGKKLLGNVHYLKNWILSMTRKENIPMDSVIEACKRYKEKDLYDKPPSYFIAICRNHMREGDIKKQKEQKYLDSIPPVFE